MRKPLIVTIVAICGTFLYAQESPLFGTWRINSAKSNLDGPVPSVFHNGVVQFRAPNGPALPYTKGAPIRIIDNSGKDKRIFQVNITTDGQPAFMTEVDSGASSQHHSVLYLERQ